MESADKSKVKKEIFENIVAGNLQRADSLKQQAELSIVDIKEVVDKAFNQLMKAKENLLAIKVSDHYNLPIEFRLEAVQLEFRNLSKNREYEKAIEWGIKYKLPIGEINTVAIKAFNDALNRKEVNRAIEIKRKYEIPTSQVSSNGLHWFNVFFERKEFVKALQMGQEFEVSRKRTITAGLRGYHQLLHAKELDNFIRLESEYGVLGDRDVMQLDDGDIKQFNQVFISNVVKELLSQEKWDKLSSIVNKLKLYEKKDNNPMLVLLVRSMAEEVILVHNQVLDSSRYDEAIKLCESFQLLSELPSSEVRNKLIETAEKTHHKLIAEDNLQTAKIIKENYGLFNDNLLSDSMEKAYNVMTASFKKLLEAGEIEKALYVTKEYGLPKNKIRETASMAIVDLLRNRKFVEAFETVSSMKIPTDNQAFQAEAHTAFGEAFDNGQMELAANLGHHFKLRDQRVTDAGFVLWKKQMMSGKYKQAYKLKKTHKIPKKMTEPIVRELYDDLVEQNETEQAVYLRNEYNISISVWNWMLEMVKKVFG